MTEQVGTGCYSNPALDLVDDLSFANTKGWHDNPMVGHTDHVTNPAVKEADIPFSHQEQQKSFKGHSEAGQLPRGQQDLNQLPNTSIFRATSKLTVTLCVLVTEMLERLSFYSVSANMLLYCTSQLGMSTVDATAVSLLFNAVLLIQASSIHFDLWFDQELSQTGKSVVYLLGIFLLTLGTGGVKANISPFGAEQLESLGDGAVRSFFNWYYWVINIGALVAYSGVAYIQQNVSFTWGLVPALVSAALQIPIFTAPRKLYTCTRPQGSVLTTAMKVIRQAGCCKPTPATRPDLSEGSECRLFARAKKSFGGTFDDVTVDGMADVIAVTPFALLVIMYYAVYSQTTSSFFVQSERMDVRVGGGKIPAAMLNIVGNIVIIILIPLIDRLVYPFMTRIGLPLTHLKRIGIGMVLSILAVLVSGVVEVYRKDVMHGGSHVQTLANENFTASSLSVLTQVPQFALIGASEIFTSVTCLEFAYAQAPASLQGLLTGLFLAAWGMGNLLSMAIILVVKEVTRFDPWYGDEINSVKMENLMFFLAGLMAANFLIFCAVAKFFKYRNSPASLTESESLSSVTESLSTVTERLSSVRAIPDDDSQIISEGETKDRHGELPYSTYL
ncbi:solute carrier family 15 member 4-like [Physella acuta]|uniref:solute carrier family 15 member 4-like n=1 Tax=Physella acuta TaxID=109671 RepID=UPI0027DBCED7|nr:solute carrier family 15 member 4-like [Physella acuta]